MNKLIMFFSIAAIASTTAALAYAPMSTASGRGHESVTICHNGNTIVVDDSAVSAHLRHGDYIGACTTPEPTPTPKPTITPEVVASVSNGRLIIQGWGRLKDQGCNVVPDYVLLWEPSIIKILNEFGPTWEKWPNNGTGGYTCARETIQN